jgi:hypothetical protein
MQITWTINYNLGKDLVKAFVDSRIGARPPASRRWDEFVRLLASPRLPSGLKAGRGGDLVR